MVIFFGAAFFQNGDAKYIHTSGFFFLTPVTYLLTYLLFLCIASSNVTHLNFQTVTVVKMLAETIISARKGSKVWLPAIWST